MNSIPYNLDKIRDRVSMSQIVQLYDSIDEGKVRCLWHPDQTPSLHVYEDHAHCFTCGVHVDIFAYVMQQERLSFPAAVKWIADKEEILPDKVVTSISKDYRGPVPGAWVTHWHNALTDEKRQYLRNRLLTDETLDRHLLGYDQEKESYVIPFFRGFPGRSEIDIIQYRATPEKIWEDDKKVRRYWGKTGYNRPSIIGTHLVNRYLNIVLFGTLDQLLAEQDLLSALSTNGSTAFSNLESKEFLNLKKLLSKTEHIIIVPDGTIQEFGSAHKLADALGAEVRYFPKDTAKDYTDWRLSGRTAEEFITEVLQMREYVYAINSEHILSINDILTRLSDGDLEGACTIMQVVLTENSYPVSYVSHALQMTCIRKPYESSGVFLEEDWITMATDFFACDTYPAVAQVFIKWADIAKSRMGSF